MFRPSKSSIFVSFSLCGGGLGGGEEGSGWGCNTPGGIQQTCQPPLCHLSTCSPPVHSVQFSTKNIPYVFT